MGVLCLKLIWMQFELTCSKKEKKLKDLKNALNTCPKSFNCRYETDTEPESDRMSVKVFSPNNLVSIKKNYNMTGRFYGHGNPLCSNKLIFFLEESL